ncbi:MAG: hypothetical protein JOZ94_25365 [Xanthobacteraceae bacterium]|nr:hypothetical protein [Xanthobacteraceae bacterium]
MNRRTLIAGLSGPAWAVKRPAMYIGVSPGTFDQKNDPMTLRCVREPSTSGSATTSAPAAAVRGLPCEKLSEVFFEYRQRLLENPKVLLSLMSIPSVSL